MWHDLPGTPFYLSSQDDIDALGSTIRDLSERVDLLRQQGALTETTLRDYYGEKRFEQIAESIAIEGSTLSVGETELAVAKGVTITGHDPGYSRDAQALASALEELVGMAQQKVPTDIEQAKRLHELIFGNRPGAGLFRNSKVRIRESPHVPPRTWAEVMKAMEQWEAWSQNNATAPPPLRAAVLHAWFVHIHPFIDGNGRTGRAITNLELIRAGYPPIIIRKKDKDVYFDALRHADGGHIGAFMDLIADRLEDALRDLERAAKRRQGYDVHRQRILKNQSHRLTLWNLGVELLRTRIRSQLTSYLGEDLELDVRVFDELDVEEFIALCEGQTVKRSWAFSIRCNLPGIPTVEYLAFAGLPGGALRERLKKEGGRPVLMWSVPDPGGYRPWKRANPDDSPGGEQMTIIGDRWCVLRHETIEEYSPLDLGDRIAKFIADKMVPAPSL